MIGTSKSPVTHQRARQVTNVRVFRSFALESKDLLSAFIIACMLQWGWFEAASDA